MDHPQQPASLPRVRGGGLQPFFFRSRKRREQRRQGQNGNDRGGAGGLFAFPEEGWFPVDSPGCWTIIRAITGSHFPPATREHTLAMLDLRIWRSSSTLVYWKPLCSSGVFCVSRVS